MNAISQANFNSIDILNNARQRIRDEIGADNVRDFHGQKLWLDISIVIAVLAITVLNTWFLASNPGWLLIPAVLVQGWLFQWSGLISHDLFVHRRVGGEIFSRIGAILLTVPRLSSPVGYEQAHLTHHRHIGSSLDSENYKQNLISIKDRLLFSTLFGIRMVQAGKAETGERSYHDVSHKGEAFSRRAKQEKTIIRIWSLTMIALTIWQPLTLLLTYWAPLLIVAPVINTIRIVLEHADADINSANAFEFGTAYKTGWFTRFVFLWDSGDCHLVHHIFPRMPFYHVGPCVDALSALIERENPRPRQSLLSLLKGWYVDGFGHRTPWPTK